MDTTQSESPESRLPRALRALPPSRVVSIKAAATLCFSFCLLPWSMAHAQVVASAPPDTSATSASTGRAMPITYRYVLDAKGVLVMAQQGEVLRTTGVVPLPGEKSQLLEHGSYLYVVCGAQGIAVLDVRQPGEPILRGQLAPGEPVVRLAISGKSLVATVSSGAQLLFDASGPGLPQFQHRVEVRRMVEELEAPPPSRPRRAGRPGLGLVIAGSATFGGLYLFSAIWAGFEPTLAIPVAGPLVASAGTRSVLPLGIIGTLGQTTGLILLIAGGVQMSNASNSSGSTYSSLRITPYVQRDGIGLAAFGHF